MPGDFYPGGLYPGGAYFLKTGGGGGSGKFLDEYKKVVEEDTPYAWWRMTATSGSTETDQGSIKSNGTYENTGELKLKEAGIPGGGSEQYAASFNTGGTHTARMKPTNSGSVSKKWTMEAWIKPTELKETLAIVTRGSGGTSFDCIVRVSGDININIGNGSSWLVLNAAAGVAIKANEWTHVVVNIEESGWAFYINGIKKGSESVTLTNALLWDATHVPNIGWLEAASYMIGLIDEVAIYTTPLSAARIKTHYEVGITSVEEVGKPPAGLTNKPFAVFFPYETESGYASLSDGGAFSTYETVGTAQKTLTANTVFAEYTALGAQSTLSDGGAFAAYTTEDGNTLEDKAVFGEYTAVGSQNTLSDGSGFAEYTAAGSELTLASGTTFSEYAGAGTEKTLSSGSAFNEYTTTGTMELLN
jgi:hypothetical protein